MIITELHIKNWRNFKDVRVPMSARTFIVGNNGLGKSNLLDALRFFRDVAKESGGGLQAAFEKRGGMTHVRSYFAGRNPHVHLGVTIKDKEDTWVYQLTVKQEASGKRRLLVHKEIAEKNGEPMIDERPNDADKKDQERLTQTFLEQISENKDCRDLVDFFNKFHYLHMVPQLVRHASEFKGQVLPDDPYGQELFEKMARLGERSCKSRLARISEDMQKIKPGMSDFTYKRDDRTGQAHLLIRHDNWRSRGTIQNEQHLSDGELRIIGLFWTLLESHEVLMLEEPEMSFNEGIIEELPAIFARLVLSKKKGEQQIILTTHSDALLQDDGIGADEVVLLEAGGKDGSTTATVVAHDLALLTKYKAGLPMGDIVLPRAQTDIDALPKKSKNARRSGLISG